MIDPKLEKYAEEHTSSENKILYKLNRETHLKVIHPRMTSGHLQGKLLEMISCMMQPMRILEIGTYTGYSTICLSKGLKRGGKLHTIEYNPELKKIACDAFKNAGIENNVVYHLGNAMDIIPEIDGLFDLVFIDADKENYLNYYKLIFDKVAKGGFILADNALWSGKVIKDPVISDKETKGLVSFNDFVQQDERVENVLLTVRDGIMMIRKK